MARAVTIDVLSTLLYDAPIMADNGDSDAKDHGGAGWAGFLTELTKNFLILRDILGYALPGAVFLAIGALRKNPTVIGVKLQWEGYQLPLWLQVVAALGACYVVGHVMAAIAYFPFNTWSFKPEQRLNLFKKGTQSELIDIRGRHPELLTELERQSTMTQLRGSTGVAMVLGYLVFCMKRGSETGWAIGAAGIILLLTFWFSAMPYIDDLGKDTIAAGKLTDAASIVPGTRFYDVAITKAIGDVTAATVSVTETSPKFKISVSPARIAVRRGSSGSVKTTTSISGGFNSAISLSASGEGTLTFSRNPIDGPGQGESTMTVSIGDNAESGTRTIIVTGRAGNLRDTATVNLEITD